MLKSEIIDILTNKHKNFTAEDIETIFNLFIRKITNSLKTGNNIELRGFGTISKKINKEKFVRNPKTNERIYKKETFKLHFKTGKTLHNKINKV
tara:strand:+ start:225 stop:506 length:282 start_codon:yes stop_codon:yes gene_type:complete